MLSIREQVEKGKLVCPMTRQRLQFRGNILETTDGRHQYAVKGGVPILLPQIGQEKSDLEQERERMEREYAQLGRSSSLRALLSRLAVRSGDYRSRGAKEAFEQVIGGQGVEALCLTVGGGPLRMHPKLVNLNIGPFPNVDVVGDAYALPYGDGAVDAVYCEAVLEHLEFPERAVSEIYRVLHFGKQVFAATPFIQPFHGYPGHYQNFTLVGHRRLFERAGFKILSAGVCVGPTVALLDSMVVFAREYLPSYLFSRIAANMLRLIFLPLRPLDFFLNRRSSAHILASSTYVHAVKAE